jgi:hypothetical protein
MWIEKPRSSSQDPIIGGRFEIPFRSLSISGISEEKASEGYLEPPTNDRILTGRSWFFDEYQSREVGAKA